MNNKEFLEISNPILVKTIDGNDTWNNKYYLCISNFLNKYIYSNVDLYNVSNAIYLVLDDDIDSEDNEDIQEFIDALNNSDEQLNTLKTGTTLFPIGTRYLVSETLADTLDIPINNSFEDDSSTEDSSDNSSYGIMTLSENDDNTIDDDNIVWYVLPDYIIHNKYNEVVINSDKFQDLSDTTNKDISNISYFRRMNGISDLTFTEDELKNFTATFCQLILDANEGFCITDLKNAIYNMVLNFFASNMEDTTYKNLNLLLGYETSTSSSASSCCNNSCSNSYSSSSSSTSTSTDSSTSLTTCAQLYKEKMLEMLKQMLSDLDFYCAWMNDKVTDDNQIIYTPDEALIDSLELLIDEFLTLGYDLSGDDDSSKSNCGCPSKSYLNDDGSNNSASKCKEGVLENYKKVLEWVRSKETNANKNKIYVIGNAMGNLMSNLYFD